MLLLSRCVRGCVNQEEHHNSLVSAGGDASTEEEEEEEKEGLSLKDTDVIDGMLEIIAILWTGIAQQLAKVSPRDSNMNLKSQFDVFIWIWLR